MPIGVVRQRDIAGLAYLLQARSDIDGIAQQIVPFRNYVSDVDANAENDAAVITDIRITLCHPFLEGNGVANGVDSTGKLEQQAVAGGIGDAAAMLSSQRIDELIAMSAQRPQGGFLVLSNQAGVPGDICGNNGCQSAVFALQGCVSLGGYCSSTVRESQRGRKGSVRDLAMALFEEVMAVGRAEGAVFPVDFAERTLALFSGPFAEHWESIAVDRREGRHMEWQARNAVVGEVGRKHGIETPLNDAVTALLEVIDTRL